MNGSCVNLENPIGDAISRVQFAPQSNNLLISSWDSCIRLYDVDSSLLRFESPNEAALLDCCFENDFTAFSAGSDGLITRYDLHEGVRYTIGNHDDLATCIGYSGETQYAAGSVDGRVALETSSRSSLNKTGYIFRCHPKSRDGRFHLVSVNDIRFNPVINGAFVTGDNEGYVIGWDAQSKRRLFELPKFPNSVASISYNHGGQLLAVASSRTYQGANEIEEPPQLFMHKVDGSISGGSSSRT
ncbi:mitotic checkpoint protein BUB3.3 isoform X2 [Carica papaya]|uniref:mitotic checkpoint protein BUB3.3 isoform X2 n=1 Tax=Carica papaya TaxID=3649 RepID=UPI000B8C8416|nr:mitotic checkpoint protein BUB3.3 isoform X2 [Carica papaya]